MDGSNEWMDRMEWNGMEGRVSGLMIWLGHLVGGLVVGLLVCWWVGRLIVGWMDGRTDGQMD